MSEGPPPHVLERIDRDAKEYRQARQALGAIPDDRLIMMALAHLLAGSSMYVLSPRNQALSRELSERVTGEIDGGEDLSPDAR
jgi:hypothetical protein